MTTPTYKAGSTVQVVMSVPAGVNPEDIVGVEVVLRDEAGVVIGTMTPPLPGQDRSFLCSVPASHNLLASHARKGARLVETTLSTADAKFIETSHYLIEAVTQLSPLENTFQSYAEALMTRSDMPLMTGWDASTDSARIGALQIAHASMCCLRYVYRSTNNRQSRLTDFPGAHTDPSGRITYTVSDIRNVMQFEWDEFPEDFKTALKRAQLAEANVLLQGDPIGDKRRQGIISETIGESSMFLRQIPEVQMAVSRAALQYLRGYVQHSLGVARA